MVYYYTAFPMKEIKDTKRSKVYIGFSGKVSKQYLGPLAEERYENEVRILKYLEEKNCNFVPQIISEDSNALKIFTTNCGMIVEKMSSEKVQSLFKELEDDYGVRHEDPFMRNITYNMHLGRFCIIDFEFAIIVETGVGLKLEEND